jgi:hypothetical protein
LGKGANKGVSKIKVTMISAATTSELTCDRAPLSAAVKLLDWLPLTGNPAVKEAPMFARPKAMNSRLASTR